LGSPGWATGGVHRSTCLAGGRAKGTPHAAYEARSEIATWITDFYNARRLRSVCGFKSPIDHERDYRATLSEGLAA